MPVDAQTGHLGNPGQGPDGLPIGGLGRLEPLERRVGERVGKQCDGQGPPLHHSVQLAEEGAGEGETHEDVQVVDHRPGQIGAGELPGTEHEEGANQHLHREP